MKGYGLVLGGGGAKGSYEIGVWKALIELEIPIIAVAGTSVGALNGAMIVQNDYKKALELWTNININTVIKMNEEISALDGKYRMEEITKIIKEAIYSGGLDVTPLKQLIRDNIDEEKIRKSDIEFGFVTYSLTDLKPISIFKENVPEGKMADYLLASASLPVFKPLEIDGVRFLDGALYDNLPISLLVDKAIRNIISVDVSGLGFVRKYKDENLNIIHIKNSESLGYDLFFDSELAKRNIEIGYYDTMKIFKKYKGKNYYLTDLNSDLVFDLTQIKLIYRYLGIDWGRRSVPQNRYLIYKLIRNIKKYSSVKKLVHYSDFIAATAEITAEIMEIERIKPYSLEGLINEIIENYKLKKNDIDYESFTKYIYENVLAEDDDFVEKIKRIISESKFAIFYNIDINDLSEKAVLYRRILALSFPKLCIANIFITFLNSQHKLDL